MKLSEFVDKIYCINLKNRKNKKKFIQKQAETLDLDIEFFNAIRNKKNPAAGCLQSHLNIIKMEIRAWKGLAGFLKFSILTTFLGESVCFKLKKIS